MKIELCDYVFTLVTEIKLFIHNINVLKGTETSTTLAFP